MHWLRCRYWLLAYLMASAEWCLAEPTIYEGFQYASKSDVTGTTGGTGFLDPWQSRSGLLGSGSGYTPAALTLLDDSLSYEDTQGNSLATTGGSLKISGQFGNVHLARTIDVTQLPNTGTNPQIGATTYVSFLARRSGEAADPDDPVYNGDYPWGSNLYPRVAGLSLFSNDGGDAVPVLVGAPSNEDTDVWRLRGQDLDGVSKDPQVDVPFGEGQLTHFVVLRIDHGQGDGNADELNLYVDPLLGSESLNSIGVTADWEVRDDPLYLPGDWIGIQAGNASSNRPFAEFTFDEFRIGQTWGDVVPLAAAIELPGDFNQDGMVNLADYTLWRNNLGAPAGTLENDPHSDAIGVAQYETWKSSFGTSAAGAAAFAVPEPTAIVPASVLLVIAIYRRLVAPK